MENKEPSNGEKNEARAKGHRPLPLSASGPTDEIWLMAPAKILKGRRVRSKAQGVVGSASIGKKGGEENGHGRKQEMSNKVTPHSLKKKNRRKEVF